MTAVTLAAVHFAKRAIDRMIALPIGASGNQRKRSPGVGQRRFAMLNVTTCNAALVVLIVLAALGPAIVDVARLAKCAIVPCRDKEPV
jgi:hypothetical protein